MAEKRKVLHMEDFKKLNNDDEDYAATEPPSHSQEAEGLYGFAFEDSKFH